MNIVLLSGGSGQRLWPLSNDIRSKQFIKIFHREEGELESMIQRVYRQIKTVDTDATVTIATSKSQVSAIRNQLGEEVGISVEPCRRDTFPAIALAAAYLKDVQGSYQTDLKNGMKPDEIPNWYNYEYEINSELQEGKDSIWNYAVTTFQYTGGAHPNTWAQWVNIDAANGKKLDKSEVFAKGAEEDICRLILDKLLAEANKKLETDTLTCVEGLQAVGILLDTDLYVPDNFLLEKEGVTFLYNTYDIAPYYMGRFQLTVPYEEINTYLIKK